MLINYLLVINAVDIKSRAFTFECQALGSRSMWWFSILFVAHIASWPSAFVICNASAVRLILSNLLYVRHTILNSSKKNASYLVYPKALLFVVVFFLRMSEKLGYLLSIVVSSEISTAAWEHAQRCLIQLIHSTPSTRNPSMVFSLVL